MKWNPTRDFPLPSEKNPKRPVVTQERYEKVLAKAGEPTMVVYWARKPVRMQSDLPVVLRLAHATGRRIRSILSLAIEDLFLDEGPPL
jgi:integrase